MIKTCFEQQNFEFMKDLQQKNQEQVRGISAQLQTGLQAFLQQLMEQIFNHIVPSQAAPPPSASPMPHAVSIIPRSALPPATKTAGLMLSALSHPPPEIKRGISGVKGSATIATQFRQWPHIFKVPTSVPSLQPSQQHAVASAPRLISLLQALEQQEFQG